MIGWPGQWTRTPSATPLQPQKGNAHFWITFNFWWSAGWSMDSNPICHPSPAKKMKCSFLDYVQLLMIGWAGRWTQTPSTTLLQPKKWNTCYWITFNIWWLARLVDGLKPHLPPLSRQKKWNAHFWITFNFWWSAGWLMDSNPIHHPSPAKKMKCSFLDYVQLLMIGWAGGWTQTPYATPLQPKKLNAHFWIMFKFWWLARLVDGLKPHLPPLSRQKKWNAHFKIMFNFWWLAGLVDGLKPHLPPISSQKHEMLIFGLCSTSDDRPGCSMDSNPICHPSTATKMKCSFLDYIQLLMISWAGPWTQTPSATALQPKKWNAHVLDFVQLLMIGQAGQWTQTPSATPLQPKKWNACFWITFNFWWLARLVHGLKPHLPPLSSQKNEMLIFGLCSTSDDQLDWSMDSNAIHHPSPAKNMKCLFLDYIQLLMIGQACRCTQTPFATSLQPKEWNAHFWIMFNFWWSARLVNGLEPHLPPISSQKHDMLIFGLRSTSDDWPGWSMDSNPIHHRSPAKKMKCLFLDYFHLLMIGKAGRWTRTPSATHLQPKTWNAHFWIMFNFWWSDGQVDGLKPHLQPLCSQKNEMLIFGLHSTSDDQLGWSMDSNPICNRSAAKKWKTWYAHFWILFNFWWLDRLVNGLKPHLPPLSSQKNEMLVFGLHSTSDD